MSFTACEPSYLQLWQVVLRYREQKLTSANYADLLILKRSLCLEQDQMLSLIIIQALQMIFWVKKLPVRKLAKPRFFHNIPLTNQLSATKFSPLYASLCNW